MADALTHHLNAGGPVFVSACAPPPDFELVATFTGNPMQVASRPGPGTTIVSIDVDGFGVGEHQIVLVGTFNLTAADFSL